MISGNAKHARKHQISPEVFLIAGFLDVNASWSQKAACFTKVNKVYYLWIFQTNEDVFSPNIAVGIS